MNKRVNPSLLFAVAVGVVASLAQNVQSQVMYENGTPSTYNGNFNFDNAQAGNEIVLAGSATSDVIDQFVVQFDLVSSVGNPLVGTPTGDEMVDLRFYANDSLTTVAGYTAPGTLLYDSTFISMNAIGLNYFSQGQNLTYAIPDVVVPQDFTWTLTFADVPSGESAGLAERSSPTVGGNYQDAWYNDGSGWQLDTAEEGNPPLEFGAEVTAVPEPSCLGLVNLAVGAGFCWMNRGRVIRRNPSA